MIWLLTTYPISSSAILCLFHYILDILVFLFIKYASLIPALGPRASYSSFMECFSLVWIYEQLVLAVFLFKCYFCGKT